jgi:hypothetical protein
MIAVKNSIAGVLTCAALLAPITRAYAWDTQSETSPVDDSENVFLSVMSDDPIEDEMGQSSHPVLWIRCWRTTPPSSSK